MLGFPVAARPWVFSFFRTDGIHLRLAAALRKCFTLKKLSIGVRPLQACRSQDAVGVCCQSGTISEFHGHESVSKENKQLRAVSLEFAS